MGDEVQPDRLHDRCCEGLRGRNSIILSFPAVPQTGFGVPRSVLDFEPDTLDPQQHRLGTTRAISQDGFEKKERSWNSREVLTDWREQWAEHVNRSLEHAHVAERVDSRRVLCIDLDPQGSLRARWEGRVLETPDMLDREHPKRHCAGALRDILKHLKDRR